MRSPPIDHTETSSQRALARAIPLVTGLISFAAYWLTLRPEVGVGDSAELALQAYQLGVTHPPGYPVHTFLGKLAGLVVADPAQATRLLSAVSTSLTVGLLSVIVLTLTRRRLAALAAPLMFAFLPKVWEAAVITEVYNVNICLVACAFLLILKWSERPTKAYLWASALIFGLSLGSGLANVLILPGFLLLTWRSHSRKWLNPGLFLLIVVTTGGAVLSWSFFRAAAISPLGTAQPPDTFSNFILYLSGTQYKSTYTGSLLFYLHRFTEHGLFWGASFLWIGIVLGIVGLVKQWKEHRTICMALLLIFGANMAYFTGYPWIDYQDMVVPSYFVFSIWIAYGVYFLSTRFGNITASFAMAVMPPALVIALLASGMKDHLNQSKATPVTDFVVASYELFPADALVFADWYKFAPLMYFQTTQDLRLDVTIAERSNQVRHYAWGTVDNWRDHAYCASASRPVVVDSIDSSPPDGLQFRHIGLCWHQVTLVKDSTE